MSRTGRGHGVGKGPVLGLQVGSDSVQSCGTCHFHAGADNRTKNQMNPNTTAVTTPSRTPGQRELVQRLPFHKLTDGALATRHLGRSGLRGPISFTIMRVSWKPLPNGANQAIGDAAVIDRTSNDVASSMGVKFGSSWKFQPSVIRPANQNVRTLLRIYARPHS